MSESWYFAAAELDGRREERRFRAPTLRCAKMRAVIRFKSPAWVIYLWSATEGVELPSRLLAVRVDGKWRQPPSEGSGDAG